MQMMDVYARRIEAKHALFVFDACFAGSIFDRHRAPPAHISSRLAQPVRQFITSGSADERVPDHSVFRIQFVAALRGAADTDRDGYVTGTELGEFLFRQVIRHSKGLQHPQYGKLRDPRLDRGDFVFRLPDAPAPASGPPAPAPACSVEDLVAEARLDALEQALARVEQVDGGEGSAEAKALAWRLLLDLVPPEETSDARMLALRTRARGRLETLRGNGAAGACRYGDLDDCDDRCRGDDAESCHVLGKMVADGLLVSPEDARAVELFQRSCDGGSMAGCAALGWMVQRGWGVARDEARALTLYERACRGGDADGCAGLAYLAYVGRGTERGVGRAARLYGRACDAGSLRGCAGLGSLHLRGEGVPEDPARARALFESACAGGYAQACAGLGVLYARGRGVPQDVARATELYEQACARGRMSAGAWGCYLLGQAHWSGLGVERDERRALRLLERACDDSEVRACLELGLIVGQGRGGQRPDPSRATALLERACRLGSDPSCVEAGRSHEQGAGVPKDRARAATLFGEACGRGWAPGCADLRRLRLATGRPP